MTSISLVDEARKNAERRTSLNVTCKVGQFLETASDEHKREAEFLLANRSEWTADDIVKAFAAVGHPLSSTTVRRHRRGDCPCPKA